MAKLKCFVFADEEPNFLAHVDADYRTSKDGEIFEICTYREGDKMHEKKKQVIDIDKKMARVIAKKLIEYFKFSEKDLF